MYKYKFLKLLSKFHYMQWYKSHIGLCYYVRKNPKNPGGKITENQINALALTL